MSFAKIGDIVVHYQVDGPEGAPVMVFANSLGTDLRIWDSTVAHYSDRFRCIRYDKRGHGLTDATEGDYTMAQLGKDLAGLLDHLGVTDYIMAGVSIGGLISQQIYHDRPAGIRALIMCDTAAKLGTAEMWQERIAAARSETGIAGMSDAVMQRWFRPRFHQENPVELQGYTNMLVRIPSAGYAGCSCAIRDVDLRDKVTNISVPSLVVCGAEDGATPTDVVRPFAESVPGADYVEIPECAHLPSLEQPQALIDAMDAFLSKNGLL